MPVGFARDEEAAVAASTAYTTAPQHWLLFTDEEINAAVQEDRATRRRRIAGRRWGQSSWMVSRSAAITSAAWAATWV